MNIVINCFGKEDISYITKSPDFQSFMKKCVESKQDGVIDFIKKKYFDPEFVSNHTIRKLDDLKDNLVEVHTGDNIWSKKDQESVFYTMFDKMGPVVENYIRSCLKNKTVSKAYVDKYMRDFGFPLDWCMTSNDYTDPCDSGDDEDSKQRLKICEAALECIRSHP